MKRTLFYTLTGVTQNRSWEPAPGMKWTLTEAALYVENTSSTVVTGTCALSIFLNTPPSGNLSFPLLYALNVAVSSFESGVWRKGITQPIGDLTKENFLGADIVLFGGFTKNSLEFSQQIASGETSNVEIMFTVEEESI